LAPPSAVRVSSQAASNASLMLTPRDDE
jgi:hypothetical protein